jgi:hypothetical protein
VLKADVWRDHLLKEEGVLNSKLTELEAEGDEKRFDDAREELSARLAEVHTRLSDMDAASGPARAAALLAGKTDGKLAERYWVSNEHPKVLGSMKQINSGRQGHSVEVGGAF